MAYYSNLCRHFGIVCNLPATAAPSEFEVDKTLFSSQSPGDLVVIETVWGKDCAYVPHPLPPAWEFPVKLWPLLNEATNRLSLLEGIGSTLPNPGLLLRPLRDREAIRSSEIEGTYANPRELLLFELKPRESQSAEDPANDQREVLNYRRALEHAEQTELPLCLRLLRELHHVLLTGVRGADRTPGEFRRLQVAIGTKGRFVPPPPHLLMDLLSQFETFLHRQDRSYHPLVDCFLAHYQFETIHPFADGNGRVGRLLLSIMVQQACGLSKPWLHLSEFFESRREEYYGGLFGISTDGDWSRWIAYCLEGVASQATTTVERCKRLLFAREDFKNRVQAIGGSVRLQGIVDGVFESPLVRITELRDRFNIDYKTARTDVEKLVEARILAELPDQYPKTYYAPEIFAIAYEGLE